MIRTLLAACCLVGLVLGGTLAPAIGVGTPVPDLGADGSSGDDGDGAFDDGDGDGGVGSGDVDGNGSNDLGVDSYGGIAAGGYPRRATVGGALSLSDHEAFRVESPRPRRWRLGAYASYTGDGWERNGTAPEPLTEPLSTTLSGRSQPRYEVRVTARRPFDGLISPWRPAFATAGDRRVLVDDGRALTVDGRIEAGDRYTVLTYGRVPREAAAAGGDGDVPPAVERRYTGLPEDTPARLGDRTAEITAGAETSHERAVAVERWLEANKAYSLDATHDRDGDVADEFVFEMAAGYCQYFATAMVAMLRTQDVPARYVTGYGPGEPVGDDEYVVRGRNAHAWVEVYVADVGWVTFDPTPGGPRATAGRDVRSLEALGDGWRPGDDGSGVPTAADDSGSGSTIVSLTAEPTPGREATGVVTRDGRPVRNAPVRFAGRDVGRTNRSGVVTGTVPYAESLVVDVSVGSSSGVGVVAPGADGETTATGNATVSFPLPTDIGVELLGDPAPGDSVKLVAGLAGEPVAGAEVLVDGRPVATTDEQGSATVTLPEANRTEITVERGAAAGSRTVRLRSTDGGDGGGDDGELDVSVAPRYLALPAAPAEVTVTYREEPVADATVVVDGETAGTTGADGRLDVGLPLSEPVTVTATVPVTGVDGGATNPFADRGAGIEAATLTGTAAVSGVRRNAGGAVAGLVVVVATLSGLARRRHGSLRESVLAARLEAVRTLRRAVAALVGLATAVDAAATAVVRRGRRGADLLADDGVVALLRAVGSAVAATVIAVAGRLRRLPAGGETTDDEASSADDEAPPTVREAWTELRGYVTVPSWRTSTPGEIARWAVDRDGLPDGAVATLRDAFRAVEYGAETDDERAAEVRAAIAEVRGAADPGDDGENREVTDD